MRAAKLSDSGLLLEVDVQELRILAAALTTVCNSGQVLANLEDRLGGTRDKAETLLVSIRSLTSIFDRLLDYAPTDSPISPTNGNGDVSPVQSGTESATYCHESAANDQDLAAQVAPTYTVRRS